ncbi:hypothetical protein D3C71_1637640 [compost metagenome]
MERQSVGRAAACGPQVGDVHAVDPVAHIGTFAAVLDVGIAAAEVGAAYATARVLGDRSFHVGIEQVVEVDACRAVATGHVSAPPSARGPRLPVPGWLWP